MFSNFTAGSLAALGCLAAGLALADTPNSPHLGQVMSEHEVASISTTVFPDGQGLPSGSGTAALGKVIYQDQCAICHGDDGAGDMSIGLPAVAGAPKHGSDWSTGTSWPYATSIFDYVRRAMPPFSVKQLSDDEVYAVTAYLLNLNGLAGLNDIVDQETLPNIVMPSADYFGSRWEKTEKALSPN